MLRIGLTGGIASGKTLVSDEFAQLGAVVIDSDLLAREVVEPNTPGLRKVVKTFGTIMLNEDGTLNRKRLGKLVFLDDEAREALNAIVHPLVRKRALKLEGKAKRGDVVIHVIPLLVETGQEHDFDGVVVVDVPENVQVNRLMHRNDLTTREAQARLRAQAPRTHRREAATWLIDNSGSQAETVAQVRALWEGPIRRLSATLGRPSSGEQVEDDDDQGDHQQ